MKLKLLIDYCDHFLEKNQFKDYCPNGLQIEGNEDIELIITGVTACEALIDAAIERNAQAILVHHGYFWKNEAPQIVGIKGNRIKKLIKNNISLIAYHLPLDAHPVVGNNAQLGQGLNIKTKGSFYAANGKNIALYGNLAQALTIQQFTRQVSRLLNREAQLIKGDERMVKQVAWCTGGAQNGFEEAIALGADIYISGEVSENIYHLAKESGVHYLVAGHHATERFGVQALGTHLAKQFKVHVDYIDINNPV